MANTPLFTAYLLKETLAAIQNARQPNVSRQRPAKWIDDARKSGLRHFFHVVSTIQRHIDCIIACVQTRLTNTRTVGLNGEIRTITRRVGFQEA